MSEKIDDSQRGKIFNRNSLLKELKITDVSSTILFLISCQSEGITGQVIHVIMERFRFVLMIQFFNSYGTIYLALHFYS